MTTPAWARLLCRFSRALTSLDRCQQIVRDELLFAFLAPNQRDPLTFDAYARSRPYLAGGEYFSEGLWEWEEALLDHPRVPRRGRVLLGAAGGGRELRVLLERGYEVLAFEPVAPLCEGARVVAQGQKAVVIQACYDDLIARSGGNRGRLDCLNGYFDLCILGWGSLSHLTEFDAALETLRAVRTLAPEAPVVVSFILRAAVIPREKDGRALRLRRGLRRMLGAVGGRPVPSGLRFASYGFYSEYTRSDLAELCTQAGYVLERFSETPYAHALLIPIAAAG